MDQEKEKERKTTSRHDLKLKLNTIRAPEIILFGLTVYIASKIFPKRNVKYAFIGAILGECFVWDVLKIRPPYNRIFPIELHYERS